MYHFSQKPGTVSSRSVHRTFLNGVEAPPRSTPTVQILHPALHPGLGWSTRNFWTRNTPPRSTPSLQILHPVLHPGLGWTTRNLRNRTTAVLILYNFFSILNFMFCLFLRPSGEYFFALDPPLAPATFRSRNLYTLTVSRNLHKRSRSSRSPKYTYIFSPAAQKKSSPFQAIQILKIPQIYSCFSPAAQKCHIPPTPCSTPDWGGALGI